MNIRSGFKAGIAALALATAPMASKAQHVAPEAARAIEHVATPKAAAKVDSLALDLLPQNSLSFNHIKRAGDSYKGYEISTSQHITNLGNGSLYTKEGIEIGRGNATDHARVSLGVGYNSSEAKPLMYGGEVNVYGSADPSDKVLPSKTASWGLLGEGRVGYKFPKNHKVYVYGNSGREFGSNVTAVGGGVKGELAFNKNVSAVADVGYQHSNGNAYNPDFAKGAKGSVGLKFNF